MADFTDEDLFDLSDDDLEAAFKEAKASTDSPETDLEQEDEINNSADSVDETENVDDTETTDEEIEIEDGSEQPEDDAGDSDHNSDESEEAETTEEDQSETDEDDLDEDSEADKDKGSEDEDATDEEEQPVQSYTFKANGKEYEFSSDEIVDQFPKIFGQAMDYTKKMQAIKPWRKTIDALEGAELTHNDVNLMIDVLKGNKDAIAEVIKRTGVDTLDLKTDEDSNYTAEDYGRDDRALAVKDVVDLISKDPEYTVTHGILSNDWDERSWNTMSENPEMIRLLHLDVQSGMYQKLQPIAEKLKIFSGGTKSDLDYYKEAAEQFFTKTRNEEAAKQKLAEKTTKQETKDAETARVEKVRAKNAQRTATKQASAKRKAAAPTKNLAAGKGVVDYLDDSDEAFDEWYKNLQDSI
jgi:hypothetical protein